MIPTNHCLLILNIAKEVDKELGAFGTNVIDKLCENSGRHEEDADQIYQRKDA